MTQRIALLTFRANPISAIPPARLRAMLAEAVLQGAEFQVIDATTSAPDALHAYVWKDSAWALYPISVPDVVIIFGGTVNDAHLALVNYLQNECVTINDVGLSKLEQLALFQHSEIAPHVIPTEPLSTTALAEQIAAFSTQHNGAVVKRSDGNQGKGLFFLFPRQNQWCLRVDHREEQASLDQCAQLIARRIQGRMRYRDFIMQKFVVTTTVDDRPSDIRVHIQRSGDGAWQITRAYVRVGEPGRMTANVSTGALQGSINGALSQRMVRPASEIYADLNNLSFRIAEIQNAVSPRPLSELGLDFLLDDQDQLWLVETNALPQSSLHEQDRATHMVAYAKYIAEQPV